MYLLKHILKLGRNQMVTFKHIDTITHIIIRNNLMEKKPVKMVVVDFSILLI